VNINYPIFSHTLFSNILAMNSPRLGSIPPIFIIACISGINPINLHVRII
jgi:hypothetical protein